MKSTTFLDMDSPKCQRSSKRCSPFLSQKGLLRDAVLNTPSYFLHATSGSSRLYWTFFTLSRRTSHIWRPAYLSPNELTHINHFAVECNLFHSGRPNGFVFYASRKCGLWTRCIPTSPVYRMRFVDHHSLHRYETLPSRKFRRFSPSLPATSYYSGESTECINGFYSVTRKCSKSGVRGGTPLNGKNG